MSAVRVTSAMFLFFLFMLLVCDVFLTLPSVSSGTRNLKLMNMVSRG